MPPKKNTGLHEEEMEMIISKLHVGGNMLSPKSTNKTTQINGRGAGAEASDQRER